MFCGCPTSVKRCDAMDHCFSLVACMPVFIVWEGFWNGLMLLLGGLDSNDFQSTYGAKNHVLQARESEVLAQSATVRIPDVQDSLRKRPSEDL